MDIDPQHECFKWEWKVSESSTATFIFSIHNGHFGYTLSNKDFNRWWPTKENLEREMKGWTKVRNIEAFGPCLPPIFIKIREMEERHKRFLLAKKRVQWNYQV